MRWKLTTASAALSIVALGIVGLAMLISFRAELLASVRRDLTSRGHAIAELVDRSGSAALSTTPVATLLRPQGAVAQLLSPARVVVARSPGAPQSALAGQQQPTASPVAVGNSDRRSLVETLRVRNGLILVVARPVHDLDLADESLRNALLIGVPVVLVLVIAGAYFVSSRALVPVERMRRRAASINAAHDGTRLPVPAARDELADLGHTLNELLDRVAESARREHALIANASHELRTPLARMQTRLELALGNGEDAAALAEVLTATARDIRRLGSLATDLLTLAALDEHRQRAVEPVDLLELVEDAVGARQSDADRLGRTINVSGEPVVASGDPSTLRQAVGNLLDNALIHGEGAMTVEVRRDESTITVSVADEGDGLDLPLQEAVERFTRGAAGRGRPGAGLGLALVAAVARAHGGEIVQRGSAIVIELPAG